MSSLFFGYACRYRWNTGSWSDRICCGFATAMAMMDAGMASAARRRECILRYSRGRACVSQLANCEQLMYLDLAMRTENNI